MGYFASSATIRATGFVFLALTAGLSVSRASVIQSTVILPPLSGAYFLGGVCVSALGRCTQNAVVSDFEILSSTQQGSNQVVAVNASYSADIFTDDGGSPGTFLGHLSLAGPAEFTYLARNPSVNPLGDFTTNLSDFDFTGTLNGNTFEVRRDPSQVSTGSTSILPFTVVPPILYKVDGSLNIFAEYSFNGAPFVPAPPRTATLGEVPEPGLSALAGCVLTGILGIASRRRRAR